MFVSPREQKDQRDADANGAVSNVECRKTNLVSAAGLKIEPQKIHDVLAHQAVHEISHDAANDQTEGELSEESMRVEVAPAEKQNHQRDRRYEGEHAVFSGERTPGCACV